MLNLFDSNNHLIQSDFILLRECISVRALNLYFADVIFLLIERGFFFWLV